MTTDAEIPPHRLDLRPARSTDLDRLAELEREFFDPPWSRDSLAKDLNDPTRRLWTARRDGRVVGYAAFLQVLDECELLRIVVDRRLRGRGLGEELLRRGLALCAEAGTTLCRLEVHENNASARNLYRKLGFELAGKRRQYYADGGDALLLVLDL